MDLYPHPSTKVSKPRSVIKWVIIVIIIVYVVSPVITVFLAAGVQAVVAKPYQIPSASMLPTIHPNDRVLAHRLIYYFDPIERGDIVVFDPPVVIGKASPYVKRVVGLPGDTVEVRGGRVLVNNQEYDFPGASVPTYTNRTEKVPDGMLYVLGDNLNESSDSHIWGFLPEDNVIGRVDLIYWPPDRAGFLH